MVDVSVMAMRSSVIHWIVNAEFGTPSVKTSVSDESGLTR